MLDVPTPLQPLAFSLLFPARPADCAPQSPAWPSHACKSAWCSRKRCQKGVSPGSVPAIVESRFDARRSCCKDRSHGAQTPSAISGRDLSRHEPGRSAGADFPRRRGSSAFSGNLGRGVRQDRLAGVCLLFDHVLSCFVISGGSANWVGDKPENKAILRLPLILPNEAISDRAESN